MIENIVERLRRQSFDLRRKPTPLSEVIPLLQEAALHIENLEMHIKELESVNEPNSSIN